MIQERFLHYQRPIDVTTLPNGLTILSVQMRSETVFVQVVCAAGAIDDKKPGTAHFLEHMLFEGQERGECHPALVALNSKGIIAQAETARDHSSYSIRGFAKDFDKIIEGLSSAVCWFDVNQYSLELERRIILRELEETKNPTAISEGLCVYPNNPEAYRPICGNEESIHDITIADLEEFHHEHYVPSKTLVMVLGDISPQRVVEGFSRIFNTASGTRNETRRIIQPKLDCFTITTGIEISDVKLYFNGPETSADATYLYLLERVCISEKIGLLDSTMREHSGISYGSTWHIETGFFPCIDVLLGCSSENFDRGIEMFFSAVDKLIARSFDPHLFDRVIAQYRLWCAINADQFSFDDFSSMLGRRWQQKRLGENTRRIIAEASIYHLSDVAKRFLIRERSGEVRYMPR